MRRLLASILPALVLVSTLGLSTPTLAQGVGASVVAACGARTYGPGENRPLSQDTTGLLCSQTGTINGTFSSTVKATAADPTYIEGSTTNPPSVNLAGYARVILPSLPAFLATPTFNLSTAPTQGSKSGGTAGTVADLIAGIFNTSLPTLTNGQQAAFQMDSSARLIVNCGTGCTATTYAQGAATSGQTGNLEMAAVTTSAPSYTTGQTSPLSLTPAGGLRVDNSGNTQPISGAVTVTGNVADAGTDSGNPIKVGGIVLNTLPSYTTGQRGQAQLDGKGNLRVRPVAAGSVAGADGVSNNNMEALADPATQNTLTLYKGVWPHTFNGTTWDRQLSVLTGQNTTGAGVMATGLQCQLDDTSTTSVTENQWANCRFTSARNLMVSDASVQTKLDTLAGYVDTLETLIAATNTKLDALNTTVSSTTAQATAPQAQTTGGCTPYGFQTAATTNATLISTGAHTLCSLGAINVTATISYIKVYDLASAPTCSSSTGFLFTLAVPANTSGAGVEIPVGPFGMSIANGLGFCAVGGGTSTDNTNTVVGVFMTASYK